MQEKKNITRYRLGIDIGGTFTDLILMNEKNGAIKLLKTPSTIWPVEAVLNGIEELQEKYGVRPNEINYFSHGTTLAVNTILERSGARVGVLTTQGFRDLLELRRLRLPKTNNLLVERPISLVPRRYVREISERILANGNVYIPINREQLIHEINALLREGVEAVAICFLHSYRNPIHENFAKELLNDLYPDVYVCTSSEVWPQQREYERSLISVINAYVGDRMKKYYGALEKELGSLGIECQIFSTKSNGGLMTAQTAAVRPVETLLSGPAAGVIGAAFIGRHINEDHLITLDMGGTSVDIAVVQGEVPYSSDNTVGDFPVIMPAVDVSSIGAGGGSIAWLDKDGVLKVGPQSAGANPGPACYGYGGELPTITDAYLLVGILSPDNFLGGEMSLNPDLSKKAIDSIAKPLGLNSLQAADAIVQVATSKIYAELLPQIARRGADISDFSLLAYGGAGPTHVFMLAQELNLQRIIIPPTPGLLCALGCLVADLRADFVKTVWKDCDEISDEEMKVIYQDLAHRAYQWLNAEAVDVRQVYLIHSADLCYTGQSFEVDVVFPFTKDFRSTTQQVVDWFNEKYERVYGFADRKAKVRLLDARVQIVGSMNIPNLKFEIISESKEKHNSVTKRVFYKGQYLETEVYHRWDQQPGWNATGPLIIQQYDSTVFVPQGYKIFIDDHFNIIGERAR